MKKFWEILLKITTFFGEIREVEVLDRGWNTSTSSNHLHSSCCWPVMTVYTRSRGARASIWCTIGPVTVLTQLRRRWNARVYILADVVLHFHPGYSCRVDRSSRKIRRELMLAPDARLSHAYTKSRPSISRVGTAYFWSQLMIKSRPWAFNTFQRASDGRPHSVEYFLWICQKKNQPSMRSQLT